MKYTRTELMPGVWLTHLHSDKFKTACMSLNLLAQLTRDTASMNALIPYVLRRGTVQYGDMEAISEKLNELYGTAIEPVVRRVGEIQCFGFYASIPEEDFLPGKQDILRQSCALMAEMLIAPATRGGLFLSKYVDSEKEKMLQQLEGRINSKEGYSVFRCVEEMCCYEDFAVSALGSENECEDIHYKKLTRHYHDMLQSCPVEIFYCGRKSRREVVSALTDALMPLPRVNIDYDIGTDVRMNAVEDKPRYVEEELDVSQGKLVMGFRLGECMEDPNAAAIFVFNAVYGSGSTSKLFMNVREKLSLCYYASSAVNLQKGIMLVASGIEFQNFQKARDEILSQLEACKKGEITDEELRAAKAGVASDLRSLMDSQGELEGFYLARALSGEDYSPADFAGLIEEVTKEQVVEIANSIECDLIYFLKGQEDEEEYENAEP